MSQVISSRTRSLLAGAALLVSAGASQAVVIGFEEFGNVGTTGPAVTNQYEGVVFSSSAGMTNNVSSQAGVGNGLNFICTATGSINCTGETILSFVNGVSDLSFLAVGSNNAGVQAKVDVFVGNALAGTEDVTVSGVFGTTDLVDLTAYSNVTSIRIYGITDGGGLGWDDFNYNAVPEPGSYALLLAGLSLISLLARRRRF